MAKEKPKSGKALKGLQMAHSGSDKPSPKAKSKDSGDPIKGLKDAVKAKQIQALSMESALQSGGAPGSGYK